MYGSCKHLVPVEFVLRNTAALIPSELGIIIIYYLILVVGEGEAGLQSGSPYGTRNVTTRLR